MEVGGSCSELGTKSEAGGDLRWHLPLQSSFLIWEVGLSVLFAPGCGVGGFTPQGKPHAVLAWAAAEILHEPLPVAQE